MKFLVKLTSAPPQLQWFVIVASLTLYSLILLLALLMVL